MVQVLGASVFFDFDGTVTLVDTGVHVLQRLASEDWQAVDGRYVRGEIGSRECLALQWAMLPRDRERLEATAAEVAIDPDFEPLVAELRAAGAEVMIVSDGFGFAATALGERLGIPVLTNCVDWASGELRFPALPAGCECAACGTCKREPIREAKSGGRTAVFVGDGTSDRRAAEVADVVFATGALATWCTTEGIAHEPFHRLGDIRPSLRRVCAQRGSYSPVVHKPRDGGEAG